MAFAHHPTRRTLPSSGAALNIAKVLGAPTRAARAADVQALRILTTAPGGTIPDIVARRYAEQLAQAPSCRIVGASARPASPSQGARR